MTCSLSLGQRMVLSGFALQELLQQKRSQSRDQWRQEVLNIYDQTIRPYDEHIGRTSGFSLGVEDWHLLSAFTLPALYLLNLSSALAPFPLAPTKQQKEEVYGIDYPASSAATFFPESGISDLPIDVFQAFNNGVGAVGDLVWLRPNARILADRGEGLAVGKWGNPNARWDESNGLGVIVDIDMGAREMTVLYGFGFGAPPVYKRYKVDSRVSLEDGNLTPEAEAELDSTDEINPVRLIAGELLPMQFDYAPYDGPLPSKLSYDILSGTQVVNGKTTDLTRAMLTPPAVVEMIDCVRGASQDTPTAQKPSSSGGTSKAKVVGGVAAAAGLLWLVSKLVK